MATYTWELQGGTPTEIEPTDILQFAGAAFNDPITVGEYNDTTHVKASGGGNDSSGNTPNNNKFISQAGGTGGDSQADWGDGTEDIDQITDAEATLHIEFAHGSSVAITDHILYAYDGTTPATAPPGVDVRLAEVGDTNFTEAEGSGAALAVNDSAAATTHDFYILASCGPTSVGLKSFKFRDELTYT